MKRLIAGVVIGLVFVFIVITIWKIKQNTFDDKVEDSSGLSAENKAEIRQFWDIYREASDLKRKGAWQRAVIAYQKALKIDHGHKDALYNLGNVFFELEKYREAVMTWRKLIEVNPLSTRAHIQLGSVYSCGLQGAPFDLDIAEQEFKRALAINKEQTGSILKLGEVSLLKGQNKMAENFFRTVLQSNSKSVEAHYLIGYIKWQAGERQEALSAIRQAVKFSKTKQKIGAPSSEGDTRIDGGRPILAEGAKRKSFFTSHWMALKDLEDEEINARQMEEEYREIDGRIKILTSHGLTEGLDEF